MVPSPTTGPTISTRSQTSYASTFFKVPRANDLSRDSQWGLRLTHGNEPGQKMDRSQTKAFSRSASCSKSGLSSYADRTTLERDVMTCPVLYVPSGIGGSQWKALAPPQLGIEACKPERQRHSCWCHRVWYSASVTVRFKSVC